MFSIRIRSSSCCFSASFLAVSDALSCLILFNSARSDAVSSSSESSSSEFSLSTGSSASGFCSNFWRFALASIARRTRVVCFDDDDDLLEPSRSSNSLRRSRLRISSFVPCPISLKVWTLINRTGFKQKSHTCI